MPILYALSSRKSCPSRTPTRLKIHHLSFFLPDQTSLEGLNCLWGWAKGSDINPFSAAMKRLFRYFFTIKFVLIKLFLLLNIALSIINLSNHPLEDILLLTVKQGSLSCSPSSTIWSSPSAFYAPADIHDSFKRLVSGRDLSAYLSHPWLHKVHSGISSTAWIIL